MAAAHCVAAERLMITSATQLVICTDHVRPDTIPWIPPIARQRARVGSSIGCKRVPSEWGNVAKSGNTEEVAGERRKAIQPAAESSRCRPPAHNLPAVQQAEIAAIRGLHKASQAVRKKVCSRKKRRLCAAGA